MEKEPVLLSIHSMNISWMFNNYIADATYWGSWKIIHSVCAHYSCRPHSHSKTPICITLHSHRAREQFMDERELELDLKGWSWILRQD